MLDDWDGLSLGAKYEAIALYRADMTMQTWEGLGADGRREAVELWEMRKARERKKEEADA